MERKEILEEAARIVTGERQNQYGDAEDSFGLIAGLWGDYLNHPVSSKDVALMMILLKVAREKGGKGKADNWVDIAGYAACGGEIATADAENAKSKDYLKMATDTMKSKYLDILREAIEEQTEDKHIPAGVNNGPFVPSYPPKEGAKCCCTDDIKKIAEENERKRELLPASFNQKRTLFLNYEVLWNMVQARKNHKLKEWREFCRTIVQEVPYFEEIFQIEEEGHED